MKKHVLVLIILLIIMSMLNSCKLAATEQVNEEEPKYPEKAVAYLVNLPSEEEREEYNIIETVKLQSTEESFIFVSIKEITDLRIEEIEIMEDGNFKELGTVFKAEDVPAGFAVEIIALRPEGAPYYKLIISADDKEEVTYYVSYNGKDGNPKIEYIFE